jgi:hypothetical protein
MPNWCNNTFNVEGEKEAIDNFEAFLNEKNGKDWFNFFAPTPVELKEDGWYEWNVSNWGCKWNCDAQDWSRDGNTISFWFDSPWGPPVELYYKIEQAGLTVKAEYMEEGMRFVGEFVDGSDETYEYQDVEDLDNIPDNLVENWNLHDQFENWEDEDEE